MWIPTWHNRAEVNVFQVLSNVNPVTVPLLYFNGESVHCVTAAADEKGRICITVRLYLAGEMAKPGIVIGKCMTEPV